MQQGRVTIRRSLVAVATVWLLVLAASVVELATASGATSGPTGPSGIGYNTAGTYSYTVPSGVGHLLTGVG